MGTHPIFESDFDCLTDSKYTYNALSMSSVNELISKISAVEKKLKESGVFIPPPAVEYDEYFKQRDKLTGNTKSVKKKLKNAQRTFLKERLKQLESLLSRSVATVSSDVDDSSDPSVNIVDW